MRLARLLLWLLCSAAASVHAQTPAQPSDSGWIPLEKYVDPKFLLACVVAFLIAGLSKPLQQWLGRLSKGAGVRFDSSRLITSLQRKKYRETLRELRYVKHTFRPNRPLDMQEVFVPLRVSPDRSATIDALQAIRQHRRLVVVGAPGAGKSMLLQYMLYRYATGELPLLDGEPMPVLLELHRLRGPTVNHEQLIGQLMASLARRGFPAKRHFVETWLKNGALLLLFDGLDEVVTADRRAVIECIKDTLVRYSRCPALVTCRTAVYHDELHAVVNCTAVLADFTDEQVARFLRAYQRDADDQLFADRLLQNLLQRPSLMTLARNPLLLTMIACCYQDTRYSLPYSRAAFYRDAVDRLLGLQDQERNLRNHFSVDHKRRVLQNLALRLQHQSNAENAADRRTLTTDAIIEQVKAYLPRLNLDPGSAQELIDEIVTRSGLLLTVDRGSRYQFAHLTLQEYLAAMALQNSESQLREAIQSDPDAWREPAKLWCSAAADATAFLRFAQTFDRALVLECLADAQEVAQEFTLEILEWADEQLDADEIPPTLTAALGGLAASPLLRGKQTRELLERRLAERSSKCRTRAVVALSSSNTPETARALVAAYAAHGGADVREAIVRMSDLSLPSLIDHARMGQLELLEEVGDLATPGAARALADLLWDEADKDLWLAAAVQLARILPQADIEEELHRYRLPQKHSHAPKLEWIWTPFAVPKSSLQAVAGRTAYLIEAAGAPPKHSPWPDLDPRITVPLFAIVRDDTRHSYGARRYLLAGLTQEQRDRLEKLTKAEVRPTLEHWRHLNDPTKYDFSSGWHYRVIIGIALVASLIALFEAARSVIAATGDKDIDRGLAAVMWTIACFVLPGWLVWRGGPRVLDPGVFLRVVVFGPITFAVDSYAVASDMESPDSGTWFQRAFGTDAGQKSLAFALAFSWAIVGVSISVGVFALAPHKDSMVELVVASCLVTSWAAVLGMGAGTIAVYGALGWLRIGTTALTLALVVAAAGLVLLYRGPANASVTTMLGWLNPGGIASHVVPALTFGMVLAIGLGASLRVADERMDWARVFILLSAPFYAWLPVTAAWIAHLGDRLQIERETLACVGVGVLVAIAALCVRARSLEARARNPLHGILSVPTD